MSETTTNTGGPAFPAANYAVCTGMTLRDWFAGQALMGLTAAEDQSTCESQTPEGVEAEQQEYAAGIAKASYRYADAMLAAREGKAHE